MAYTQLNFTKGEISPELQFRNDLTVSNSGLALCENAFPKWEGGALKRGGFKFIAKCANPASPSVLIPFIYSREDAYVLEFSNLKMRIFRNGGLVLYPAGHPNAGQIVEIATPYSLSDIQAAHYTQIANILTIATPNLLPREIKRIDHHDWQISVYSASPPPWLESNVDKSKNISVSAQTGTVTLTSDFACFNANQIGILLKLEERPDKIKDVTAWEASKHLCGPTQNPFNILSRANGKVYKCTTNQVMGSGTSENCFTGTFKPEHEEGIVADGNGQRLQGTAARAGVDWEYQHSGFGVVRITAVTGAFNASGVVVNLIPNTIAGFSTYKHAFEAWNAEQGYPETLNYFGDRLYFGKTKGQPEAIWGSEVGNYKGFKNSKPVLDTDSININLAGKQLNEVQHILPLSDLMILSSNAEWLARGGQNKVITPATSGDLKVQGYNGSTRLQPIIVGATAIFQQYMNADIRSLGFAVNPDGSDGYGGRSLNAFARHLFNNYNIKSWCFAREPYSIIWAVRSDGALLSQTTKLEEEVVGWARHKTDGEFYSVASIPDGNQDTLYACIKRGAEYFIEQMSDAGASNIDDYVFADSALELNSWVRRDITINGASGYLPNDTVDLLAFGGNFNAGDVGRQIHIRNGDNIARLIITSFVSSATVLAKPITAIPEVMRGVASPEYGFAVSSVSGITHLQGHTVSVLADGEVQNNKVVSNGAITLDSPAVRICVGLPYEATIVTLPLDYYTPSNPQTTKAQKKNVKRVTLGSISTRGVKVGSSLDLMQEATNNNVNNLGLLPDAMNSYERINVGSDWSIEGQIIIKSDYPLPMHITAVELEVKIAN